MSKSILIILIILCGTFSGEANSESPKSELHRLLLKKNYQAFDKLAQKALQDKSFTSDGFRKYNQFYEDQTSHDDYLELINEWINSGDAKHYTYIIRGNLHISQAWAKRGSGWGHTVSKEGWMGFREHLLQAKLDFEKAYEINLNDPHSCISMITVCRGLNLEKSEMNEWFERGRKIDPLNYRLYNRKLVYLFEKWHGNKGEANAFSDFWKSNNPKNGILYNLTLENLTENIYRSEDRKTYVEKNMIISSFKEIRKQWLADYPYSVRARIKLPELYYQTEEYDNALEEVDKIDADMAEENSILFLRGKIYYQQDRYKEAKNVLLKTVNNEDIHRPSFYYLGKTFYYLKNYQSAIKYLTLSEIDDKNPKGKYWIGRSHYGLKNYKKAIQHFKSVPNPDSFSYINYRLGKSYYKLKNYEKALEHFIEGRAILPEYDYIHYYLGLTHYQMGKKSEGDECFKICVGLDKSMSKKIKTFKSKFE